MHISATMGKRGWKCWMDQEMDHIDTNAMVSPVECFILPSSVTRHPPPPPPTTHDSFQND